MYELRGYRLCLRRAEAARVLVVPVDPAAVGGPVSEASLGPGLLRLGLIGSPNSGKTTIFNALTGLRAKVGNYPGVTVERREGDLEIDGRRLRVIDLPGTYSLTPISPDEAVVGRVIAGELGPAPDALLLVADACTLERSLLMIAQVLRRGVPTCLVLTMTDELHARGGVLDLACLERALGDSGARRGGTPRPRTRRAAPAARAPRGLEPPAPAAARAGAGARGLGGVGARERPHAAGRGPAAPARRSTASCCTRSRARCSSRR